MKAEPVVAADKAGITALRGSTSFPPALLLNFFVSRSHDALDKLLALYRSLIQIGRPMAIAPSKLGQFVSRQMWNADDALLLSLRAAGLVKPDAPDDELIAVFRRARQEHDAIPEGARHFNSPEERVRVFLQPYLSAKGRKWAVPLKSLDLPDKWRPWWKFWG